MTSFTIPVEEINGHAAFFRRAMEQLVKDQGASVAARTAVKNIHSNVAFLIDYMERATLAALLNNITSQVIDAEVEAAKGETKQ